MKSKSLSNQSLIDDNHLLTQKIHQLEQSKEARAVELTIANKVLIFETEEKAKRAAELIILNKRYIFESEEKDDRAAELAIANKVLLFETKEKSKRAAELIVLNEKNTFESEEKDERAAELAIANKVLLFETEEKEDRAAELIIVNEKHTIENEEKAIRAAELVIANEKIAAQKEQLQHAQKLESLGILSSGIAHNFNNILAIIIGYCGLTKRNFKTAEANIPKIEKAAERAAELCRQMMSYGGKDQLIITDINVVKQVDEIVGMLKSTLPKNAVIKNKSSTQKHMIKGDPSQLYQVIMNLIINASEAIGRVQGEVNISLCDIQVTAGKVYEDVLGDSFPYGEYVCLEVTDNGCGMDEITKSRLFEPFYTTKFTGRGLGMSAVLGIIKSHGGFLQVFSEEGQGTTFKVYLPALAKGSTTNKNESLATPPESWQRNNTILLVEDEEVVRLIAKENLEMFGFTVLAAANGKEALEIYQNNTGKITLVFTDVGMPEMDGYELTTKLKNINPELPIIIASGYGDTEVKSRIRLGDIAGVLNKPYNLDKLEEVLKGVLGIQ